MKTPASSAADGTRVLALTKRKKRGLARVLYGEVAKVSKASLIKIPVRILKAAPMWTLRRIGYLPIYLVDLAVIFTIGGLAIGAIFWIVEEERGRDYGTSVRSRTQDRLMKYYSGLWEKAQEEV
jgi:hypothetical protein